MFNSNLINPSCLSYTPSLTFYIAIGAPHQPPLSLSHFLSLLFTVSSMTYRFLLRAINQGTLEHLLSFAITPFPSIHLVIDYGENFMRIPRLKQNCTFSWSCGEVCVTVLHYTYFPCVRWFIEWNFLLVSLWNSILGERVTLMDCRENRKILTLRASRGNY